MYGFRLRDSFAQNLWHVSKLNFVVNGQRNLMASSLGGAADELKTKPLPVRSRAPVCLITEINELVFVSLA